MDGYSTDKLSARLITKQGPKNPNPGWGFFMSRDGRYSAKSQEGGAVMSRDGRYSAKSQEGGAVMSRDGGATNAQRKLIR